MMLRAKILKQAAEADQRSAERKVLKLTVSLTAAEEGSDALIHDLSQTGLRIETEAKLALGDELTLDLPDDNSATARVVWHRGGSYGCEFHSPISKGALGAAVLRAPFEIPANDPSSQIEEVTLSSDMTADDLARWHADFEKRKSSSGEQLIGFRNTAEGDLVAIIARLN